MPARARLAIGVNGQVAAVTVSFEEDDVRRFAAIVAPSSFVRGSNSVEVLAVSGHGGERRFERLRGSALGYRLVREGGRETIVDSSGRRIAVVPGDSGSVDRLPDGGGNITIAGWAGTTDPVRAASRVLAFAGIASWPRRNRRSRDRTSNGSSEQGSVEPGSRWEADR